MKQNINIASQIQCYTISKTILVLHQKARCRHYWTLTKDLKTESDNKLKTEILNNQLKSVFTKENTNFPKEPSSSILAKPDLNITTKGVAKLLYELKTTIIYRTHHM